MKDKKQRKKETSKREKKDEEVIIKALKDTPFRYQESFRALRTNIKFLSENRECKKIIVTSAIPNEGKTSVAINLAMALSATNSKVVLIDADLRKPRIHHYMNISKGTMVGLTNALHSEGDLKNYIRLNVDNKGLSVIPSGVIPPYPAELLGSPRMGALIKMMGEMYDYVIIDTAPITLVTDAAILSQFVNGVLMVLRQKKTTFKLAQQAKKNLEAVNANILGVVFNDFDVKRLDADNGYYNYQYDGEIT